MSHLRRGFVAITVLAVIGVSPAPAASRMRTTATIFRAFNSAGVPTIQVQSKSGRCFAPSATSDRNDAWRCLVGNFILDPCFSSAKAHGVVICPDRQLNGGIMIRLTRALPGPANRGSPSPATVPWNVQLANGQHCLLSSGASTAIHGVRLNYFCDPGTRYGLWGFPDRRAQPWTILSGPFTAKRLTQRLVIVRAWM
ncbi:MAG TPA: hypothetical protein VGI55_17755 [Solirubrobacteraceae bacterium]